MATKTKRTPRKPAPATNSKVEAHFLAASGRPLLHAPTERIGVIEVPHFPALGRLAALRFLEWIQDNPEGVASLPTGKTPEHFIKWTQHYLAQWDAAPVRAELEEAGIDPARKPSPAKLHFVQIDEFYPIDPAQRNSFHYYVLKHYVRGFGMDPKRALLIDPTAIGIPKGHTIETVFPGGKVDLSLRSRNPKSDLERLQQRVIQEVDQFCVGYEDRIRALGGIGFFLGGIGPDGHIGFNARGSHLQSPTRLTHTNYETEAAAAGDLGGIEVSRGKPVITIGLETITRNRDAVVVIFAAGEAKAPVVADAIQQPRHVRYPATALHGMPNARFYLTRGAAIRLEERRLDDILRAESIAPESMDEAVIDRAAALGKRLDELAPADAKGARLLEAALSRTGRPLAEHAAEARQRLLAKIERGMDDLEGQSILHTGPHHDDIMLGYMPYVMHLVRRASNTNKFCVLTSGFTAVTNDFLRGVLEDVRDFLSRGDYDADLRGGAFLGDRNARAQEAYRYLDGIASRSDEERRRAQARRMLHNLMVVYDEEDPRAVAERLAENLHYLATQYPGKKDIPIIQKLKGMQREYEEELIWGHVGASPDDVFHARLGFYTGDIFTDQPTQERDVAPVLDLLLRLRPTVVSLAFDPEGAGPDTHYKVLQVLHEALLLYRGRTGKSPTVWGYRNVWHRFHLAEANVFVPASLNTLAVMENSFLNCFGSQRNASFPSYEFDGPFCHLAQRTMVEQFRTLRTCLGERFFTENKSPRLRATRAFVLMKEMALDEFSGAARRLASAAQATGGD